MRERRIVERWIKAAKFPTAQSLDSFDFPAFPQSSPIGSRRRCSGDPVRSRCGTRNAGPVDCRPRSRRGERGKSYFQPSTPSHPLAHLYSRRASRPRTTLGRCRACRAGRRRWRGTSDLDGLPGAARFALGEPGLRLGDPFTEAVRRHRAGTAEIFPLGFRKQRAGIARHKARRPGPARASDPAVVDHIRGNPGVGGRRVGPAGRRALPGGRHRPAGPRAAAVGLAKRGRNLPLISAP